MKTVTISSAPKSNGYQAKIAFSGGVSISSTEAFPSIGEAVTAAATKLINMPERLTDLDHPPSQRDAGS